MRSPRLHQARRLALLVRSPGGMTAGQPLEITIVARIVTWLNNQPECRAVKNHGSVMGQPTVDITACVRGRMVQLEVKRPGQRATPRQLATLGAWHRAGAVTGVVTSLDEAQALLVAAAGGTP